MIAKCKVIYTNTHRNVIVFDFNGKSIQMTHTLSPDITYVYVELKDGTYRIVSENEYINSVSPSKVSVKTKKTNVDVLQKP